MNTKWVANSMVEYSAFNRFVPGSNPGQPNYLKPFKTNNKNFGLYIKRFKNKCMEHKTKIIVQHLYKLPPGEFESPLPP
mgnify:CR=1 FL=1